MKFSAVTILCAAVSPAAAHYLQGRQTDYKGILAQFSKLPPVQQVCEVLRIVYPNNTSFPNSTIYNDDNTDYWTAASALGPACIFAPTKAQDMGNAVLLLKTAKAPFAVRGGGHMPIADFNNIDSRGVLLSSSSMNQLSYGPNKASLNIGPGNQWQNVYKFVEPDNLLVVGGRVGIVGIPGYMTGGGVSFLGNQYGWAASNLVSYEVVTADGKVVKATANNQYSDLFWALKGGGNSFGIVTNIEVRTLPAPAVTVGDAQYGTGDAVKNAWFDAIVQLGQNGNIDDKHGVIPLATIQSYLPDPISYSCSRFYNGADPAPAVLANFTAPNLTPLSDTFRGRSLSNYIQETTSPSTRGLRQRFYFMNIPADRTALETAHDTFFSKVETDLRGKLSFFVVAFAAMPMPTAFFSNAAKVPGGDPQGIDPSVGPQIWIEFSHTYMQPTDEPVIDAYLRDLDATLRANLAAKGLAPNKFLYLNDADRFQDVFGGYPAANVQRLKSIRAKYDSSKLFTTQLPGGWKVDAAK